MEEEIAAQKRKFDFCLADERKIAAEQMSKRDEKIEALQKLVLTLESRFDRRETPKPEVAKRKASQGRRAFFDIFKVIKDLIKI